MRQNPLCLAFLLAALSSAALSASDNDAGGAATKFRLLAEVHAQLQSRLAALQQEFVLLQKDGAPNDGKLHAQLAKELSELPAQVKSYGALQSDLQIADGGLAEQVQAEIQTAEKAQASFWRDQEPSPAAADDKFPTAFGRVKEQVAQLLTRSAQKYPQLARTPSSGYVGGAAPPVPPPPSLNGVISKIAKNSCGGTAFDGGGGCGGVNAPPDGNGGLSGSPARRDGTAPGVARTAADGGPAGSDLITDRSNSGLSGGRLRLDQAAAGIDGLGTRETPSGDDLAASPDQMLSARLKAIFAKDPKAINARDYLSQYQAFKSGKPDPAGLAAWRKEVDAYLRFKEGGHVMGGVQRALAAAVNPSSIAGGKPDTAASEACWQALAKDHPDFAQGCADNPRTAAMMAGAYQAVVDQVKGLASPMSIAILLGTLLVTGLASGGVADVIALLLAVGFTAWMVWKIIRDYGPKLVSSLRDLISSKSGSAESFVKWKDSAYYLTTTLVAVAGIYFGAKGISKLAGKISTITGREIATAGASSDAAAAAGKVEPAGAGAAGGEAAVATDALMAKAVAAEPRITAELQQVTEQNGGELVGLKNRLKEADSLTEKIAKDMKDKGKSGAEAAEEIGDSVRYTSILPEGSFTRGVDATLNDFKAKGYQVVKFKNTFQDGNVYKGINCQLRSPEGHLFELQFHTVESFELKSAMHDDYKIYRNVGNAIEQRRAAFDRMKAAARGIKAPAGVGTLGQIQPVPARP